MFHTAWEIGCQIENRLVSPREPRDAVPCSREMRAKQLQTADRPVEQVEGLEQLIANVAAEGIDGRLADARDPEVFRDLRRAHGLGRVLCQDSLPRWIACAISLSLRTSSIEEDLLRLPPPQPGTTGVLCVETFARTDLSMFRCARTSSYGVNANHCASETSAKWSDCHSSRYRSVVVPVFSM